MPERGKTGQVDGLTDPQSNEGIIHFSEDFRYRDRIKGFFLRSIPRLVEQLCKEFPEYLIID